MWLVTCLHGIYCKSHHSSSTMYCTIYYFKHSQACICVCLGIYSTVYYEVVSVFSYTFVFRKRSENRNEWCRFGSAHFLVQIIVIEDMQPPKFQSRDSHCLSPQKLWKCVDRIFSMWLRLCYRRTTGNIRPKYTSAAPRVMKCTLTRDISSVNEKIFPALIEFLKDLLH